MKTPLRILLIDDNPDDRILARRKLEQEFSKLQVQEIADAAQLEQVVKKGNFDLVITDYQLRWIDGLTILRDVKARYPDCPVVMFTGTGSEEVAVEAMKAGLDDYIIKSPHHYARLSVAVRTAVNRAIQHQALQDAQNRYQRMFEGVPVGLYRMLPTGQILEANSALLQLLGYTNLQALLEIETGLMEHYAETEAYRLWQARMEEEGVVQDFEMPLHRCDRILIWVRHNARAIRDERGKILYYEGAIEDITQRKQAEEERTQLLAREQAARAEAEAANRLKDEFLATLSHELRTPLNAILGWASLLRSQKLNADKTAHAVEIIERNARSQTQLIEDLLDVSRIIRGQLRLNINSVDLNQIIETALDTVRPAAEAKSIQLESCLKPATGSINGDPDRLQQIVWNLLSNAIKFTPPQGRVTIYLEWVNNSVQIKVKDTGKGLPANAVPYIFERFRQVESTTTRSHGGLGLGLAIVRHLVELHGGTVWCESPGAGMGATFIVELPLPFIVQLPLQSVYWQVDDSELASPQVEDNQLSQPSLALAGLRVLVVEDEPDALEYFKIVLEKEGAQVAGVTLVSEALNAIKASLPDVLVSDIGLPGEDGYSLIAHVRNMEAKHDECLPAVALTAYAREEDRQRALDSGFQMHLSKPVDPDELVRVIAKLSGRQP